MIASGWKLFAAGKRAEAIVTFRELARSHPDNVPAHRAYETAMINSGRYVDLIKEYRRNLSEHKDDPMAYYFSAGVQDSLPAIQALAAKGLELDQKNPWLRFLWALTEAQRLGAAGQIDRALSSLNTIQPLDPFLFSSTRSALLLAAGRYTESAYEAGKARLDQPFDPEPRLLKAGAAYADGSWNHALLELNAAESLGDYAEIHLLKGDVFMAIGQAANARSEFQRALLSPRDNMSWTCARAGAELRVGKIEDAETDAAAANRQDPFNTCGGLLLAGALLTEGRYDDAERAARIISQRSPDDPDAAELIGNIDLARGRFQEAKSSFDRALARRPRNFTVLLEKAEAELYAGNVAEAQSLVQQARTIAPQAPGIAFSQAIIYRIQGTYVSAAQEFYNASRADPENYQSFEGLGNTLSELGRYPEAEAALRKAADLAPTKEEKSRVGNELEAIRFTAASTVKNFPADETASAVRYSRVSKLGARSPIAYRIGGEHFVGFPWLEPKPAFEIADAGIAAGHNSWLKRTLFFVSGVPIHQIAHGTDYTAYCENGIESLDIPSGRRRTVFRFSLPEYSDSSAREVARACNDSSTIRKIVPSEDGKTLYFSVGFSSYSSIERVSIDGAAHSVVYAPGRLIKDFGLRPHSKSLLVLTCPDVEEFDLGSRMPRKIASAADCAEFSASPDGTRIALAPYTFGDAELRIVDIASGRIDYLGLKGMSPSWSPDGRSLAYLYGAKEARILDLDARSVKRIDLGLKKNLDDPDLGFFSPSISWSPDSRYILFSLRKLRDEATNEEFGSLTVVADLRERRFWMTPTELEEPSWSQSDWRTSGAHKRQD